MKETQDRQKSYVNLKRRSPKFKEGEPVFLKLSPISGVMKFGKFGKLSQGM